ncbi:MAG: rhodanese-like domain-containing protein [Elusimicrobia bacterium]|nr:rhodanese-like domain-containing protein [Elusimicrobiota bacterium]
MGISNHGPFDLEPSAAAEMISKNKGSPSFVILDVRTPAEFSESHLEEGVLLDYKESDFKERLAALDKTKTYIVHCAVGGRSARAVQMMRELGIEKAYNLKGGIERWRAEGFPTI